MVEESLKVGMQVQQAVRKANGMLAFIARGFEYRSKDVLLQLYRALVEPHLECCVQFWSPSLRKDHSSYCGCPAKVHQTDSWNGRTDI